MQHPSTRRYTLKLQIGAQVIVLALLVEATDSAACYQDALGIVAAAG